MLSRFGWKRSIRLMAVSSFLTIVGFSTVCVTVMLDMRRGEEELARQSGENLASTIEADISRNIEVYDLSLRAVASNLAFREIDSVSRELRHLILFDHAATARHFGAIQVFSASGNLTIDSSTLDPEPQNVAGAEYFTTHRDTVDGGLFISRPMVHRGSPSIVLSRRINDREGHFAGVVAGTIRFSYFHELFGRLKLGDDDTITVLRHDGVIVMRRPFDAGVLGRDVSLAAAPILAVPSGHTSAVSALDGIARLFVWHGTEKRLIVVVGKPLSAIYAMWNRQAIWIGSVLAVLVAFASLMTFFLAREIARRARAEERLEQLAATDGLTRLNNRRKFDVTLAHEWQLGARSLVPLSLLMIDVDHFKSYNDRFGHQAGDKALMAVAGVIASATQRPGNSAARYGGEEFALLLPGTGLSDALAVAEDIRVRVAQWTDSPVPFSVSIGVAALRPDAGASPAILVELADRALYEAKRAGRNRTSVSGVRSSARVA